MEIELRVYLENHLEVSYLVDNLRMLQLEGLDTREHLSEEQEEAGVV